MEVTFVDSKGAKLKLRPEVIKGYVFYLNGTPTTYVAQRFNFGSAPSLFRSSNSHIFLKVKINGYLKLFDYYITRNSGGHMMAGGGFSPGYSYTSEITCLQKGSDDVVTIRGLHFRKDMSQYLYDCPALVQKIEDKVYRKDNIEQIVREYNEWIATQKNY